MTSEEAGEDRASLNKQLLEACLMGDGERVRRLLEEGADVNARDGCGNTRALATPSFYVHFYVT